MTTNNLDLKSVKNKRQKKLCSTCLSFVSVECPISGDIKGILKCLLIDFGIDEFFQSLPPDKELKICSKCYETLKYMVVFKERVQNSFNEFKKYWCSNMSNKQNQNTRHPQVTQPIIVQRPQLGIVQRPGPVIVQGPGPVIVSQSGPVIVHLKRIGSKTNAACPSCTIKDAKELINEKQNPTRTIKEEIADIVNSFDDNDFKQENDTDIYEPQPAAEPIENDKVLKIVKEDVADMANSNENVFIKTETDMGITYQPESMLIMKHNDSSIENDNVATCNDKFKNNLETENFDYNIVPLVKNNAVTPNKNNAKICSVVNHITIERFSKEAEVDLDIEKSIQSNILFRKQEKVVSEDTPNTKNSNSNTRDTKKSNVNVKDYICTSVYCFHPENSILGKIKAESIYKSADLEEKKDLQIVKVEGDGDIDIGEEIMLKPKYEEGTFMIENPSVAATFDSPNVTILTPKIVNPQNIDDGGSISSDSDTETAFESDKTSSTYGCQAMILQGQSYNEYCEQKLKRRKTEQKNTAPTKKSRRKQCFSSCKLRNKWI